MLSGSTLRPAEPRLRSSESSQDTAKYCRRLAGFRCLFFFLRIDYWVWFWIMLVSLYRRSDYMSVLPLASSHHLYMIMSTVIPCRI